MSDNRVSEENWKMALDIIHKQAVDLNNRELEVMALRATNNGLTRRIIDYDRACHSARWALENIHNQDDECWKGTRRRALRNLDKAL